MGDGRDGVDIRNIRVGVAQRLEIDGLGIGLNGGRKFLQIVGVHKGRFDAVQWQGMGQQVIAAAVDRLLRDDVISLLGQRQDGIGYRRGTGGESQRSHTAFQRGDALFQHFLCGVRQPAVDVAGVPQTEAVGRMGGVVEHIGCGLVDGNGPGIGGGIGLFLADVQLKCFKFIVGHDSTSF